MGNAWPVDEAFAQGAAATIGQPKQVVLGLGVCPVEMAFKTLSSLFLIYLGEPLLRICSVPNYIRRYPRLHKGKVSAAAQ